MLFSGLFFYAFFLPICLLFYFKMPDIERKNRVLLIFSLIFYAWSGLRYLLLLFAMTALGYFAGRMIQSENRKWLSRKGWLIFSVAAMIAVLGVFKYTGFFIGTFGAIFHQDGPVIRIALPMGISFYTFKLISYVADVYNGKTKAQEKYSLLLLYTALFHHSMSGPIVRYTTIASELTERKTRISDISTGIFRFCVGLAKKSILANHCAFLANSLAPASEDLSSVPAAGLWLGALFYMLEIYLDFSAYSDMAIGLGLMMGFHYEENFNYPYAAASVRACWRRWHISLSSFFRDYVYIPLGGNRRGEKRTILNLLIVWVLTGLWHGASWNYVLWGLYYFAFIVLEHVLENRGHAFRNPFACHVYTLVAVYFGWILFRFEDVGQIGTALMGMFGLTGSGFCDVSIPVVLKNNLFFLMFAILAVTPIWTYLRRYLQALLKSRFRSQTPVYAGKIVVAILFLVLSLFALVGNSYQPFLYKTY